MKLTFDTFESRGFLADMINPVARQMVTSATHLGMFTKNPGFHEERGWRLVVIQDNTGAQGSINFRDTKYGPAPYVAMPLGTSERLPLTHVVFGPQVEKPAKRSIRMMLEKYGYNPEISEAKATYRT